MQSKTFEENLQNARDSLGKRLAKTEDVISVGIRDGCLEVKVNYRVNTGLIPEMWEGFRVEIEPVGGDEE